MCGRFALFGPKSKITRELDLDDELFFPKVDYNVAPTDEILAIRLVNGVRRPFNARWGLVWRSGKPAGPPEINVRSETALKRPPIYAALQQRRVLIPANGFYEWLKDGKARRPFWYCAADQGLLSFAAVYQPWADAEGNERGSLGIFTKPAEGPVAQIHERMPLIIRRDARTRWLSDAPVDPVDSSFTIGTDGPERLIALEVSTFVSNVAHDGPECLVPVE